MPETEQHTFRHLQNTEAEMEQIICRNVTLGYDSKAVVSGINFTVCEGDYLCIIGENGSGKSTLMKALLGLVRPLSGTIEFVGGARQSGIGYLPQQTTAQKNFPASVREIVLSGCLTKCGARPFYGSEEKAIAEYNMDKLGIADLAGKPFAELSGGQKQRVLLARALCAADRMLLLDEPVSGLDPRATADMYDTVSRLNKEDGMTVIMISHDISAVDYAKSVLCIGETPRFFISREDYLASGEGPFAGADR